MAISNDSLALTLLVDATADAARADGQRVRDNRAAAERAEAQRAAGQLRGNDILAMQAAAFFAVTVVAPFLIGHFVLTKTFVLDKDPRVFDDEARGIMDHFLPTYLAGLVPIALVLGVFLVARRPWQHRTAMVAVGWVAIAVALVILLPMATSKWDDAERSTVAKMRETSFPFADRYYDCASSTFDAENGIHQRELWQVHLGRVKGSNVSGCNKVSVYRGWTFVGTFDLPDGNLFTGDMTVDHVGWSESFVSSGSSEVWSESRTTGARLPMNPNATTVHLATETGQTLTFTLDGASRNEFTLG